MRPDVGEAVNLASRMESHGRTRCIQVTCNTYELIKDLFDCESLGLIEVKGAGVMEVWRVIGRKRGDVSLRSMEVIKQTVSGKMDYHLGGDLVAQARPV